jgi:crotonobetainyl-CoA:carnitine CoA-transferase CaiB-like acyl-CoA transferase
VAADNWRSAPLLGEDNDYVFREILGLDDDEVGELAAEGVI